MGSGIFPQRLWPTEDAVGHSRRRREQQRRTIMDWSQPMPDALCHMAGQGRGVGSGVVKRLEKGGADGYFRFCLCFSQSHSILAGSKLN